MRATALETGETATVYTLALHDRLVGLGPHFHVFESDAMAGSTICTDELDRRTLNSIHDVTVPVLNRGKVSDIIFTGTKTTYGEGNVRKLYACTGASRLRRPVLVDVKTIRGSPRDEVLKLDVLHVTRPMVALDHERLVAAVCVHVPDPMVSTKPALESTQCTCRGRSR